MSDKHWAIFALRDIKNVLDRDRYEDASHHLKDAIAAILARDEQTRDVTEAKHAVKQFD